MKNDAKKPAKVQSIAHERRIRNLETHVVLLSQALREIQGQRFKTNLDDYPHYERTLMIFASQKDYDRAIELLWDDLLKSCPHLIAHGGLTVPADSVVYFRAVGLKFSEERAGER